MQNRIYVLRPALRYLATLPAKEQGTIQTQIDALSIGAAARIVTKQLRGKIKELIIGSHRFTYFQIGSALYFVRGFRKKSRKTPRQEIEYAQRVYDITRLP